ncbi:MAG TPA: DUF3048 domain-containing protein, partial [Candidatus Dojkabacteria bacterium]|nr:DUF3048 domain-containing protein [Candidatus Dojkabacteria bacterium]
MQKEISMTDAQLQSKKVNTVGQKEPVTQTPTAQNITTALPQEEKKDKPKKKKTGLIIGISALVILTGIFLFYYFGIYKAKPYKKPSEVINLNNGYILPNSVENIFEKVPTPVPLEPKTEESPINGKLFTKTEIKDLQKRRPVAVMINNHAEARPQSGLN